MPGLQLQHYAPEGWRDLKIANGIASHYIADPQGRLLYEHRQLISRADCNPAEAFLIHADQLGTRRRMTDAAGLPVWWPVMMPLGELYREQAPALRAIS